MKTTTDDLDSDITPYVRELEESLRRDDDPALPYQPHLEAVHSFTRGYAQRIPSQITGRDLHGLSRPEKGAFMLFDWRNDLWSNLREQFPLPLGLTLRLARRENITHPWNRWESDYAVMSVDLLATAKGGERWLAVDVKPRHKESKRTRWKLKLAELAMALVGVEHQVLTADKIPNVVVRNYQILRHHQLGFDAPPVLANMEKEVEKALVSYLKTGMDVFAAATAVAPTFGISVAAASNQALRAVALKRWHVDMNFPIGPDHPLRFLSA